MAPHDNPDPCPGGTSWRRAARKASGGQESPGNVATRARPARRLRFGSYRKMNRAVVLGDGYVALGAPSEARHKRDNAERRGSGSRGSGATQRRPRAGCRSGVDNEAFALGPAAGWPSVARCSFSVARKHLRPVMSVLPDELLQISGDSRPFEKMIPLVVQKNHPRITVGVGVATRITPRSRCKSSHCVSVIAHVPPVARPCAAN